MEETEVKREFKKGRKTTNADDLLSGTGFA